MISKKEFIGKKAKIVYGDKEHEGIIVNETKETIVLKTNEREVTFLKINSIIIIDNIKISGKKITKRPEERIKSC